MTVRGYLGGKRTCISFLVGKSSAKDWRFQRGVGDYEGKGDGTDISGYMTAKEYLGEKHMALIPTAQSSAKDWHIWLLQTADHPPMLVPRTRQEAPQSLSRTV